VPEHGEYDPGLNQWYCSYWMSEELWMEIHDYSPPDPGEDSISPDGAFDPPSITENMQPKPTDEGHTKSKTERTTRNVPKNHRTIISLGVRKNNKEI
jgi:hypothetical protein